MGLNRKLVRVPIVQSDTTVYDPPLLALEIYTAGDVSVVEAHTGTTITKTFPTAANGGSYPYKWEINIRSVLDTNTTVVDAALLGYRD